MGTLAAEACPNCGAGPIAAYCATCGERQPSHADYSARAVALEVSSEFLSVDGRLWRTIVALLTKPGLLTKEYFSGRRGRYMRPFSLFILLNVAFFFVQPRTGLFSYSYENYVDTDGFRDAARDKQRELFMNNAHFARHFADTLQDQKKSLLLVAIPVFAFALMIIYLGSGRVYVEHLVFAVHAYAYTVFYLTALGTLWFRFLTVMYANVVSLRPLVLSAGNENGVDVILAMGTIPYFSIALHRFYGTSYVRAIPRAVGLFAVQGALVVIFRILLFHTTLAAL